MFKWTEIKSWAKNNGFVISKTPKIDEYFWENKKYECLQDLVLDLWNKKTNNKYGQYQKNRKQG